MEKNHTCNIPPLKKNGILAPTYEMMFISYYYYYYIVKSELGNLI